MNLKEKILSSSLLFILEQAKQKAKKSGKPTFGVPHLALAILEEKSGVSSILKSIQKDVEYIKEWFEMHCEMYQSNAEQQSEVYPDDLVEKVIDESERSMIKLGTDAIDPLCVFTAVIRQGVVYTNKQLYSLGISENDFYKLYDSDNVKVADSFLEDSEEAFIELPFCKKLKTKESCDKGALILGRDAEIRTILEVIQRKESRGVLIVGDPGVGKSSILTLLAKTLVETEVPMECISLETSKLLAASNSVNEVSKKLSTTIDKISQNSQPSIFCMDDLHVLIEANTGNNNTIINLISSYLDDNSCYFLATITSDNYRKSIEKHPIKRKLEVIQLEELAEDIIPLCIGTYVQHLSKHFDLQVTADAIKESIHHSQRYFKEDKLPASAIDLLDRTLASVDLSNHNSLKTVQLYQSKIQEISLEEENSKEELQLILSLIQNGMSPLILSKLKENYAFESSLETADFKELLIKYTDELIEISNYPISEVTDEHISAITAEMTGIPLGKIQADEKDKLLQIDSHLKKRVKGQNIAIETLADAIIESRSGLSNPKQPIGSFFFLGPTGTGKTELTKSLASLLFDDESAMIRFDMSEFKEEHSAALLYGAPPGYVGYEEGGMLVNKIRQKPYSVVLFDEIEKAHHSVYDVFLQMMDEGQIHDKLGRTGDFSNAIIIFTSNIGSEWISEQFEQGKTPTSSELVDIMAKYFRPEFLGRLTEVVPFASINKSVAKDIFLLQFNKLKKQLQEQKNIELTLTETALDYLADKGFSKKYGARPIAGVIRTYIKKNISKMIVSEAVISGDTIQIDIKDNALHWEKVS
ncbi:AAA family ATPase [Aureivirga marina]|uniref:AAA family ATPase n=1 Tax=Aureivirga marina TaxID=1182451 RepID=UPI0018CB495B|nr:ATP-dependent Clp protease ATP-binding subunit [Aureivirga marina]